MFRGCKDLSYLKRTAPDNCPAYSAGVSKTASAHACKIITRPTRMRTRGKLMSAFQGVSIERLYCTTFKNFKLSPHKTRPVFFNISQIPEEDTMMSIPATDIAR